MSSVVRADARHPPIRSGSVNLVIISFPYYNQRHYEDGGDTYPGQIGNEDSAQEYLEALWAFASPRCGTRSPKTAFSWSTWATSAPAPARRARPRA